MTYSPDHVANGHRLTELIDTLERDLIELRHWVSVYGDAVTMPGRRRSGVDADGTGRQATHGPSRPTEATALNEQRLALQRELKNGAAWLPRAIAIVRGATASMDRALSRWEGDDTAPGSQGDT
ncbi:DUF7169 domain-containing protein [Streptomyces scabiei]